MERLVMQIHQVRDRTVAGAAALLLGATMLALQGCSLDPTPAPVVNGPSETNIELVITATPDLLNADGVSKSFINAVVREGSTGNALPNRLVYFVVDGGGPLSSSFVITDGSGNAGTFVTAPTDPSGNGFGQVVVSARTVDNDFNQQIFRSVSIELRSPGP